MLHYAHKKVCVSTDVEEDEPLHAGDETLNGVLCGCAMNVCRVDNDVLLVIPHTQRGMRCSRRLT